MTLNLINVCLNLVWDYTSLCVHKNEFLSVYLIFILHIKHFTRPCYLRVCDTDILTYRQVIVIARVIQTLPVHGGPLLKLEWTLKSSTLVLAKYNHWPQRCAFSFFERDARPYDIDCQLVCSYNVTKLHGLDRLHLVACSTLKVACSRASNFKRRTCSPPKTMYNYILTSTSRQSIVLMTTPIPCYCSPPELSMCFQAHEQHTAGSYALERSVR